MPIDIELRDYKVIHPGGHGTAKSFHLLTNPLDIWIWTGAYFVPQSMTGNRQQVAEKA
jgi:hypothetical protein